MQENNPKQQKAPQAKPYSQKAAQQAVSEKIIRLADTDLHGSNKVSAALRQIYGISFAFSNAVINTLNVPSSTKLQDLSEEQLTRLRDILSNPHKAGIPDWAYNWRRDENTGVSKHFIGNDLKAKLTLHIQMLKTSKSYRGYRHAYSRKMRGQRVRSRGANFKGRVGGVVGVTKKAVQQQAQAAAAEKK